ncbi:EF-hand domain-containing protein [Salinisphaera hydrothermalis]|uniref:EF-hand domain-containing protein n=1 Tax=Salinisphaera hydrothermalis (strain C41B8) TaxID=1304275 RepID=A0A084IN10_SALHC|nr:EF-hand domain-containing protein [Salinisphaera hydrothermalis]KEZ78094.1 hypothetical protein C41B8_05902 [Salinisphaera hydrothermalis C41B8]
MNKYLTLSLIAAGLSVSAAGFAADNNAPGPDRDSQAVFKKLDTNGDGKLSAAEMTRLPEVMTQQRLDKMDTNHDGKIEKSEFEAHAKARADRMFARLDTNHDGSISIDEMAQLRGRHHMGPPKRPSNGDMPPPPPSDDAGNAPPPKPDDMAHRGPDPEHHRWHRHGRPTTDQIFAHMDTNNDGYVSAQEWQQAARQWRHHHGAHPAKPAPADDSNG